MGKAAGVSRRRKKAKNPKIQHKKKLAKKKKQLRYPVVISNDRIKNSWSDKKTVKSNMRTMGLTVDPNKLVPIPTPFETLGMQDPNESSDEEMDVTEIPKLNQRLDNKNRKKKVADELEEDAIKQRQECKEAKKNIKLSTEMSKFVVSMIETHGNDFESMQKDSKNVYQMSSGQIRKLIKKFMSCRINKNAYLRSIGMMTDHDMTDE